MTWNNDAHGLVCKVPEAKLYLPSHSWAMKLSQLHKQPDAQVRIATYSINPEYAQDIFRRRPHHIRVICNSQFKDAAAELSLAFPLVDIRTFSDAHAKLVLIEPNTVYLGSANFVKNTLADISVGLRSKDAHDHYAQWFDRKFNSWTSNGCGIFSRHNIADEITLMQKIVSEMGEKASYLDTVFCNSKAQAQYTLTFNASLTEANAQYLCRIFETCVLKHSDGHNGIYAEGFDFEVHPHWKWLEHVHEEENTPAS